MQAEIQEIKPELNEKERILLYRIMKTALNEKCGAIRIKLSYFKDLFPDVEKEAFQENLVNVLVKYIDLPVLTGKKYVHLFESWTIGEDFIIIRFSDDILANNPERAFEYVIEMYCNPNKRSFIYRQNE